MVKSWKVTYKRNLQIVDTVIHATTESEARKKAEKNGIVKENGQVVGSWDIVSIKEWTK